MKILAATISLLMINVLTAQVEDEGSVLPVSYPVTRYTAVWENSPFEREVVKPVVETFSSTFGKDLALEGLIRDSQKGFVAYMRNLKDNQPIVVTNQPSERHSYRILSAVQAHNPAESTVTITDGKEKAEIGYVATMLTQAIATPARRANNDNQERRNVPNPNANRQPVPPRPNPASKAAANTQPNAATTERPNTDLPAIDDIDDEPRRRRILLPGASRND
ncbi:MAG: hypothetical protein CMO55_05770 [Verrucomicrobiales bacterium]|nr:hypothetical protein [Verrucomicrobiales bacterium]